MTALEVGYRLKYSCILSYFTFCQLFTEEVPYSHLSEVEYFTEVIYNVKGIEPTWPGRPEDAEAKGLLPEMWDLMRKCWKRKPSMRIDSDKLRTDLIEFAIFQPASIDFLHVGVISSDAGLVGSIRRIRRNSMKRGWFDHVWDAYAELRGRDTSNIMLGLNESNHVTVRLIDASRLQADVRTLSSALLWTQRLQFFRICTGSCEGRSEYGSGEPSGM